MSDWIKAFNPTATITTEAEALKAARASAIAIFIGVAFGALSVVMMMNGGMEALEAAVVAQGADPQVAGMTGAIAQFTLYSMIAMVVIQLILGFVQWVKPNMVIPILFIVLVVYGLGSTVLSQIMAGQVNVPDSPMNATWILVLSVVVLIVELILHIAGVRGASALAKFREARGY